jgi:CRP/FNR family transcriptional regulator
VAEPAQIEAPVLGLLKEACRVCSLYELCWPIGLSPEELKALQSIIRRSTQLSTGSYLFRTGDRFTAIYALRSGSAKSFSVDAGGRELVHGFHLQGELLGFDAVWPDRHRCNAIVLEPCMVCAVPYADIERLGKSFPQLVSHVVKLMSRQFAGQMTQGEGYSASQRLAAFLLNIHERLRRAGHIEYEFTLPMSREDIASYISISPETLSRLLTKFKRRRLIGVDRRRIRLLDPQRLDLIAQGVA